MVGKRVDVQRFDDLRAAFERTLVGPRDVRLVEPEQHAVAVGLARRVAELSVLLGVPGVQLQHERVAQVKQMHRLLYRKGLRLDEAVQQIAALRAEAPQSEADIALMLDFLAAAPRGIVR